MHTREQGKACVHSRGAYSVPVSIRDSTLSCFTLKGKSERGAHLSGQMQSSMPRGCSCAALELFYHTILPCYVWLYKGHIFRNLEKQSLSATITLTSLFEIKFITLAKIDIPVPFSFLYSMFPQLCLKFFLEQINCTCPFCNLLESRSKPSLFYTHIHDIYKHNTYNSWELH